MFYGREDVEGVARVRMETVEDRPVGYENPFTAEASERARRKQNEIEK